ncbi:MAG: DUF2760 domain-containing protein [Candidatus Binatia bacterium]
MATRPKLKRSALIVILLLAVAVAAGNYFVMLEYGSGCMLVVQMPYTGQPPAGLPLHCLFFLAYLVGAPLVIGLLLLLAIPGFVTVELQPEETRLVGPPSRTPIEAKKPVPAKPTPDAAVQLLALFQREGRLVDFLREDIQPYDDAQIGAAVRTIHQSCRQTLAEHLTLEPVLSGQEGDEVTVPKDFDPSAIRLTGNVSGEPPFRGSLRHAGWRAARIKLPDQPHGQDAKIIAPAEVEIP